MILFFSDINSLFATKLSPLILRSSSLLLMTKSFCKTRLSSYRIRSFKALIWESRFAAPSLFIYLSGSLSTWLKAAIKQSYSGSLPGNSSSTKAKAISGRCSRTCEATHSSASMSHIQLRTGGRLEEDAGGRMLAELLWGGSSSSRLLPVAEK